MGTGDLGQMHEEVAMSLGGESAEVQKPATAEDLQRSPSNKKVANANFQNQIAVENSYKLADCQTLPSVYGISNRDCQLSIGHHLMCPHQLLP